MKIIFSKMTKQMSRIESKQSVLQSKSSLLYYRILVTTLFVLTASISFVKTATCPDSVPPSAAITTEQYNFSGYTTYTYGVFGGPVSNSLYYMYRLYTPASNSTAIKKVDVTGSQSWVASFAFQTIQKSLSVDAAEQSVYLASFTNPLVVLRLSATSGNIVNQDQYTGINGKNNNDIKIFPLVDLSGYFVIGYDSSNTATICKYTFSSSSTQCQKITNIYMGYGQLMISNNQFFVLGLPTSGPKSLKMFKITFSSTAVDWANQIVCTSETCSTSSSESLLSSDKSKIYSFFIFGMSSKYLNFAGLSVLDGSVVTTRYISDTSVSNVRGSALNGDYMVASTFIPYTLVIYSISSSTFIIKSFSLSSNLFGCEVESFSGRFVIGGYKGGNGYTTKFVPQSISSNSDFSSATWLMTTLSPGTDNIESLSGVTIASPDTSFTPDVGPYANQTVTYISVSNTTSDIFYQVNTQSFSIFESTSSTQTPNLSCSFTESSLITYSLNSYNNEIIPSFVSIDPTTGVLSIVTPNVSSSTDYNFYITSTISGKSISVQKIVNLTVKKCTTEYCNTSKSETAKSETAKSEPAVTEPAKSETTKSEVTKSEVAKSEVAISLSISIQGAVATTVLLSFGVSFTSLSSLVSIWSAISQIQILFFLFLTGAFIPKDIEVIITGLAICLNPFSYLQLKFNGNYNFISNFFDFGLENSNLDKLGIQSDSTIVNMTSLILSFIIICFIHLCIALTQKLLSKESKSNCCSYVLSGIHCILQKVMIFFTFALYIRIILQTNQFVLISCVSEIYHFNFSETKRIISIIIAFFVFIVCIALIVITFILTLSKNSYKLSESTDKRNKFAHLFTGVSLNKKSHLFVCFLQIRRVVFVILLITVGPKSSIIAISLLVGFQIIYLGYLIAIRPYKNINCNVIEIINELYFLVIIASLLRYNTDTDWGEASKTAYTCLISSNSFVGLFVNVVDGVRKIIIKCRNKFKENKKDAIIIQENNVQPNVASRIENSVNDIEGSNVRVNNQDPTVNIQFGSEMARRKVDNKVHVKR